MTILILANIATALIAFALLTLVTVGFAPHLRLREHNANSRMSLFVAATSGLVWARSLWGSLLRPLAGELGWMQELSLTVADQAISTGFNLWAIVAALAALGALHQSLPEHERRNYNWITAPFFPRKLAISWRT